MKYIKPEAEIVDLENEDIITASFGDSWCYGTNGDTTKPNNAERFFDYWNCIWPYGYAGPCFALSGTRCSRSSGGNCDKTYGGIN